MGRCATLHPLTLQVLVAEPTVDAMHLVQELRDAELNRTLRRELQGTLPRMATRAIHPEQSPIFLADFIGILTMVGYPNVYLVTPEGTMLLTHGHYFECYWAIIAEIVQESGGDDYKKLPMLRPVRLVWQSAASCQLSAFSPRESPQVAHHERKPM
jgi:hypothetical protein